MIPCWLQVCIKCYKKITSAGLRLTNLIFPTHQTIKLLSLTLWNSFWKVPVICTTRKALTYQHFSSFAQMFNSSFTKWHWVQVNVKSIKRSHSFRQKEVFIKSYTILLPSKSKGTRIQTFSSTHKRQCLCNFRGLNSSNLVLLPGKNMATFEPHHAKTCLRGFRPGETQTSLLSYRD